ncbi:MAG TPA: ring-cleaving dioxygenase [Bryobacteraceae bacterium]|jgi:glyoxalase family protein
MAILGLHHVTALAGEPQRNLDFYTKSAGMRLVKRTVNFDDPASYHFYFSTSAGEPGTLLTFFPWITARAVVHGAGEIARVELRGRVEGNDSGRDPDGVPVSFIEGGGERRLLSVTLNVADASRSGAFFRDLLGFEAIVQTEEKIQMAVPGGGMVELLHSPGVSRAKLAAGSIHHVAFRVRDEAEQLEWSEKLTAAGVRVSPVKDRHYFHSIYFREPGGVLLEIATDGPGFGIDEVPEHFGEKLCLPPWLEPSRESIEKRLPQVRLG